MAIKKNSVKKVVEAGKKPIKKAPAPLKKEENKKSPVKKAVNPSKKETLLKPNTPVEQQLASVLDDNKVTPAPVKSKVATEKSSAGWVVLAALLLVIFAGILLHTYNLDFRNNFNKVADSVGLGKYVGYINKTVETKVAEKKDPFELKLTIVYNKDDANQKATIEGYLKNIESNLENTKTVPTWIDQNEAQGKDIIVKLDAKFLPIFISDESIKKHPQYAMFAPAIKDNAGMMVFQSEGMEYLKTPEVGAARFRGADPKTAKLVVIEYSSLTCGFCKMMGPVMDKLAEKYGKDVSIVTKHYNRGGIDSTLAQATECAGEQGKFDKMVSLIFEKQADFYTAVQDAKDPEGAVNKQIANVAKSAGVNSDKVLACIKSRKYADLVQKQTEEGQAFGIIGTPSIFVGKKFLGGAASEEAFFALVDGELKK